jgi:DnaJ homolog subfamily C member 2
MTSLTLTSGIAANKVSMSLPKVTFNDSVVPFGRGYFDHMDILSGKREIIEKEQEHLAKVVTDDDILIPTNITFDTLDKFTYYDVLGLSKFVEASDKVLCSKIKVAFHMAVKLYHPDKQIAIDEEDARTIYLKIQNASITLADQTRRRQYDSLMDFDEKVPSDAACKAASKEGTAAFCALYAPVFKRNGRFSMTRPCPEMGDENTPYVEVANFYSFWIKFDSWRDFSAACEHDLDNAGSRHEKREWQKENDRQAKKMKKAEVNRVADFVMKAQAHDPRVIAVRDAKKNEKAAAKLAAEELAEKTRLAEIEFAKGEAERAIIAEEKRKADKIINDKMKKNASKFRNTFRKLLKLLQENGIGEKFFGLLSDEECEMVCKVSEPRGLNDLNTLLGGEACLKDHSLLNKDVAESAVASYLAEMYVLKEQKKKEELRQVDMKRRETKINSMLADLKKKGVKRVWTAKEYAQLAPAMETFKSSRQKWREIANHFNETMSPAIPFTMEDISKASTANKDITAYLTERSELDVIQLEDSFVAL